jgi:hypothetical protein
MRWRGMPALDRLLLIIIVVCVAGVLFGFASLGMLAVGG